jgi:hypothetical protein
MDGTLSDEDIVELLGAFALNAVEPFEAAAIRDHLTGCPVQLEIHGRVSSWPSPRLPQS